MVAQARAEYARLPRVAFRPDHVQQSSETAALRSRDDPRSSQRLRRFWRCGAEGNRAGLGVNGVLTQITLGAWRAILSGGARDGSGSMTGGPRVSDSNASAGNTSRRWTRTPRGSRRRSFSPWLNPSGRATPVKASSSSRMSFAACDPGRPGDTSGTAHAGGS